jgi:hypothetical protein
MLLAVGRRAKTEDVVQAAEMRLDARAPVPVKIKILKFHRAAEMSLHRAAEMSLLMKVVHMDGICYHQSVKTGRAGRVVEMACVVRAVEKELISRWRIQKR